LPAFLTQMYANISWIAMTVSSIEAP